MANSGNYMKYAREADYEPQSFYFASGSSYEIFDELRRLGAKRVLFVCNKTISKYKNYSDLSKMFEENHYRVFEFIRPDGILRSTDIIKGLGIYKEFNCDTIVSIGGTEEIDCAKLISAMYTNDLSNPTDLVGLDKLKKDISLVCCIVTDNSCAASATFAEFMDEGTGKWSSSLSAYLIPQMVVVDTDIAMRTDINVALDCALTAFGVAIESYLSPVAYSFPEYRANAVDACRTLNKYIDLMMEAPDDSYYRRRVAVAGLYSGLSSRFTGYGLSHLAAHSLISRFGSIRSCTYLYILTYLLSESDEEGISRAAEFARQIGVVTKLADDKASTEALMDMINRYLGYYSIEDMALDIAEKDISSIVSEILKESAIFGFDSKVKGTFERLLRKTIKNC